MSDETTKKNEEHEANEPEIDEADTDEAENDEPQDDRPASTARTVDTREEMEELVSELRAEITRLKVEQAKARTESWMKRHPGLTALLSVGVGVAAGYGIAKWTSPDPRPRLSDRAREGLKHLADRARETAAGVSLDLEDRAARAGEEAREIGRRLLEDAERAGASAGERARTWSQEATRLARELGEEASEAAREKAREAQEEGSKRAREFGEKLSQDVERAEQELSRRARETADKVSESVGSDKVTVRQSAIGLLALVSGSYLAKKIREWLS